MNPKDEFYSSKRENGIIISLACDTFDENCFCTNFGITPYSPKGDIACHKYNDFLVFESITDKGKEFLDKYKNLFEEKFNKIVEKYKASDQSIYYCFAEDYTFEKFKLLKSFNGQKIRRTLKIDGIKLFLEDNSWILVRPSGTEPLLRIYFESQSKDMLKNLQKEIEKIIL